MFRRRNGAHAPLPGSIGWRVALLAASAGGVFVPALARATSLSGPITDWSSGVPSYISMYEYVPTRVAASPPVLVVAHYCGGSANAMFGFSGMPAIEAAANTYGFIMVFAQTTNPASSADCWDVGSKASLTHDGGGDTQAIAEMVQYEISKRGADASRVYMMGASSGAMLTEAMLAVYPEVFKAGAEFSGVPAGCWSDGWSAASNWGATCASGEDTMTAQAWGDLVRGMYPGYTGYRPRIQLWHGTADKTINYNNEGEAIKEWTNVLGLSATPNSTDTTSTPGFTIEKWQNSPCGFTVLEAHIQANGGHTTPIDSSSVIDFFGLDKAEPDPQITACTGAATSGGAGGSSGARGGSGGAANSPAGDSGSGGTTGGGGTAGGGATAIGRGGANAGGSSAGGSPATGVAGVAPSSSDSDSSNGCTCTTARTRSRSGASLALLAVALTFARTRGRRRARRAQ